MACVVRICVHLACPAPFVWQASSTIRPSSRFLGDYPSAKARQINSPVVPSPVVPMPKPALGCLGCECCCCRAEPSVYLGSKQPVWSSHVTHPAVTTSTTFVLVPYRRYTTHVRKLRHAVGLRHNKWRIARPAIVLLATLGDADCFKRRPNQTETSLLTPGDVWAGTVRW